MAEFTYNNAKNANTSHTSFKLNCRYHPWVFYEEDVNPWSKSKSIDELLAKLQDLMTVCRENFYHSQELQKQGHNKDTKPRSYVLGNKVWLNNKHLKTKQNWKLEAKFFGLFQIFHPVGKQTYKIELLKRWKIHDVFYVSMRE